MSETHPGPSQKAQDKVRKQADEALAEARSGYFPKPKILSVDDVLKRIAKAPKGPKTVVIFDFDGTLIAGYSANAFLRHQLMKGDFKPTDLIDVMNATWKSVTKSVEMQALLEEAIGKWGGRRDTDLMKTAEKIFDKTLSEKIYPEMVKILMAHRAAGHTIAIASSATRYQVEPTAQSLGVEHVMTSVCEVDEEGILTGRVLEPQMWGPGKAKAVKAFVKANKAKLADTWFYADGDEEIGLMEAVGHPVPTNPGKALAAAAETHGWGILKHKSRGSTTPELVARSATGLSMLMPFFYSGMSWRMLTGDKRAGANMTLPAWCDAALLSCGVKLNVAGKRNLWAQRPAVFLFNHRTNFDAIIVGALVRTDVAGVAKAELKTHPVSIMMSQLMPTAFVGRTGEGPEAAAKALEPVTQFIERGYSILIAPEGTRTRDMTVEVGPFKKGAFHMAMAAGIPVVPIVIRNALDLGGRNAMIMRPGTVDVAVLPPIPTADWTAETMSDRIADVRQLYVDTLKDWPDDD